MKVAVIGTGTLGPSIAQTFAQCGAVERVYLCKGRSSSKYNGKERIETSFRGLVQKGKISAEDAESFLNKIETGEKELASHADLLIEAITEDVTAKKTLFTEMDGICEKRCIFTTNTSSLPISLIGENLSRPLIGLHFFNPAPIMKLVEVVSTEITPPEIVKEVSTIAKMLGKTPVYVKESPGFIVNRILIPMINEAIKVYAEGIASAEDIDTAMCLGANHPMGPLALGDLIGLDVVLDILNVILKETGDNKYLPQPLLKKMVREKKLGRKTGEGFYKY